MTTSSSSPKLCSICLTSPSKYRCPRHPSTHLCSLPCTNRHKLRASCPGTRDPTSYIKKSSLTPSSLESDYNFLSTIERSLPPSQPSHRAKRQRTGEGNLDRYLAENKIHIHRAPQGMKRAEENVTRWLPKAKRVAWSVEWIFPPSARTVTEVWDDVSLDEALARAVKKTDFKGEKGEEVYILRPRTRGKGKVLDKLDRKKTITEALRGRAVDEFPTFYVVQKGEMPEGFEMGEEYDERMKGEKVDRLEEQEDKKEKDDNPAWDEKRVLEMLRRDVDRLQ